MKRVSEIIGDNARFSDPAEGGYYIFSENGISAGDISLYYEKLSHAAANADRLIAEGFREEFFGFYGTDREKAISPEKMRERRK